MRSLIVVLAFGMCLCLGEDDNTVVDYRFRNLTEFNVANLPHPVSDIAYLSLQGNNLDAFPSDISELSSLERSLIDLVCESCDIKTIYTRSLRRLPLLETLLLPNNAIQMIEKRAFRNNPNMWMMDLTQNKLTSLPTTILVGLHNMKKLDLSSNRDLAPQKGQPFLVSNSLEILKCNNCGFSTTQMVTFSKLPNLKKLHLADNRLLVAPCLLPSLTTLGAYSKKIFTDYQRCLKKKFHFVIIQN
ncbi:leucine-rich repeat-containing G-protein coupled receptor 5-like isoform X2 [Aedes albopictus]|uniref:Leucine-rich repeat protein n=1 Tax=Aedes albopictus TaxID=7160 RepID=A0ABM1YQ16_AEDAL